MTPIEDPREILVIKLSSLGDILLITPVLATLAAAWPRARVTVLCGEAGRPILARCPFAHRVLAVPDSQSRFPFFGRAHHAVQAMRETGFDLAIDLQGLARSWYFLRRARASFRVGKGRFPGNDIRCPHRRSLVRHALESYFETSDALRIARPPREAMRPVFIPTTADRADALSFLAGGAPVVFAPFTARRAKQWPFACWLELGRRLAAGGDRLLVAGGTADRTQAERLAAALGPPAQAVAGRLSIGPFGALLERARVLVSPDSFAMHLAAALGTPQVALFGPTDPARTGPWEGRAVVLREQPLAALGVDQVQQAVRRVLELPG